MLFAPSPKDDDHARQRGLLRDHEAGLEDRDLLVEDVFEDASEASAAARRELGVEGGAFMAVLVGRDGGAKVRSPKPITPQELFGRIDAMPMRRREMRQKYRQAP